MAHEIHAVKRNIKECATSVKLHNPTLDTYAMTNKQIRSSPSWRVTINQQKCSQNTSTWTGDCQVYLEKPPNILQQVECI